MSRGEGYEYVNFIPALESLGCETSLLDAWDRGCCTDFAALNRTLLERVELERPDVVLAVLRNYEIWLETWDLLKKSGLAATVNWATDDNWKYEQFSKLIASHFHAYTTTYAAIHDRYIHDGIANVLETQWAANTNDLRPPIAAVDCRYDVTFVGSAHGTRPEWIQALRNRGIQVQCFGYGWDSGAIPAAEIPAIVQGSRISLNFANAGMKAARTAERQNQIKARRFEIPGYGGFLLTQSAPSLGTYYEPGTEIETFTDLDEAVAKIQHYLAHPEERDRIAKAGHARTCAHHTYDQRMKSVLDFARGKRDELVRAHGVQGIDWKAFEGAIACHRLSGGLHLLKGTLNSACTAIWGPVRGPRAARRLTFEVSWRVAGAYTYTAGGWPGRMFYNAS